MSGPATTQPERDIRVKTVLIVEDNEDSRTIYREFLEYSGYRVVEATNGAEAIEVARRELPDVILMDISMPRMDGLTATRILKADAGLCAVPIIALTAHAMLADEEMALSAGCDGYLAKPVEPRAVRDEVERRIGRARPD